MRLNDAIVRGLPHPETGQVDYADDTISGLSVRVGKTAKTFRLVIGTGADRKRFTIGRYEPPHFTLAMARDKARDIIAAERLRKTELPRTTFADAVKLYDRLHASTLRVSSARDLRRSLYVRFGRLDRMYLTEIGRHDIAPLLDHLTETPAEMRAAFVHLRGFFRWCVGRGYLENVPTDRMAEPKRIEPRSRVLSAEELVAIWNTAPDTDYGRIIKLCTLSGQRRGQWAACRYEYIRDDTIVWPAKVMKSGREHTLPLIPAIRALLPTRIGYLFPTAGGIPFNNWAACKDRLDEHSGVTQWRHHDLRRTWSTVAADELGIEPHYIESVLAHTTGSQVARIYNRAKYLDPMRKALLSFEEWLQAKLTKPEDTNARDISGVRNERA